MEQDKKKILSDLYAIRATMSVVAENDDKAEPSRKEISDCSSSIQALQGEVQTKKGDARKGLIDKKEQLISSTNQQIDALKKEFEELEEPYQKAEKGYQEAQAVCKRNFFSRYFRYWAKGVSFPFSIDPFVTFLAILCLTLVGIWGILLIFISVPGAIMTKKRNKQLVKQYQGEMKTIQERRVSIQREIGELQRRCEEGCAEIDGEEYHRVKQELQTYESGVNLQITVAEKTITRNRAVIEALANKSQDIIIAARKAYPLIDFRDWENVDLLIYYFETGRADDMKEALQLVDKQRQTDQITRAIAMASATISKSIDMSLRNLGGALAQSFSVLSRQMAKQHTEMRQQAEQQQKLFEAQVSEIRAQTAEQRNAQAMNQALLNKISLSSKHLADQMDRQMREVHGLY